ncbi:tumor protein D53 isoform X3 [Silurus meridionalis]|uniref:tumor protein D53 isoform X3 n=1 Tax=Silurus meridionalis TaxID=175797 RepID=UPI001EEC10B4|nr:tumor protein D53 isoform X3 [Silurus meridionalis]
MEQRQGPSGKVPDQDVEEGMGSEAELNNTITDEERKEMQNDLIKLEEEIVTLKQVLASKEKHQAELKHRLGLTTLSELKQNLSKSWNGVQSSTVYKKTSETLSTAGQKTTSAISNFGTAVSKKIGDMSYSISHSMSMPTTRNTETFKSFEEKVETTVSSIKTKVGGTASGGNFEDVLSSAAQASAQNASPTASANDLGEHKEC